MRVCAALTTHVVQANEPETISNVCDCARPCRWEEKKKKKQKKENKIPHPILNHNVNGCVVRLVGTKKKIQLEILRLIDMEWNSHGVYGIYV